MSGSPMKLILTQEVSGLGAPGDVVEVAGGYGRNYLVPRGLAMRWSRGAEKQIELIKRARSAREIRSVDDAKAAAERLAGLRVRMQTRAGSGGRLFGSISTADIAAAVKNAGGPDLDRRKIEIGNPIKTIGAHQVAVRLHPEVSATVEVEEVAPGARPMAVTGLGWFLGCLAVRPEAAWQQEPLSGSPSQRWAAAQPLPPAVSAAGAVSCRWCSLRLMS